jgi:hypothetical protein
MAKIYLSMIFESISIFFYEFLLESTFYVLAVSGTFGKLLELHYSLYFYILVLHESMTHEAVKDCLFFFFLIIC